MSKFIRVLFASILLGLSACTGIAPAITTDTPSVLPVTSVPTDEPTATFVPTASPTDIPIATSTPVIPQADNETIKAQVDKLAAWFIGQGRNPGLGVAIVVRNPQTGVLEATLLNYGTTAKDNGQPVTSDTVYEIGSITKVFTGILLAEAVGSGEVQLDDPIQKYLPPGIHAPEFESESITLVELATHRSALPRDPGTDSMSDLYSWLNTFEPNHAPGSEYAYSNLGYALLGDILARLSGMDFDTLEFQSVSLPLGLMDTRETLNADQIGRLAHGYTYDGSPADYFPQSGALSSAGYMHSTLNDMTRFLIANMQLDSSPLAAPITLAQTLEAGGRNAGQGAALGWDINELGSKDESLSKGGATLGFTSYISFRSDGSSGFVLLTNGMNVESLVPHMQRIMSGQ